MNHSTLPKIVVICGPTGAGKTSFAVALAQHFEGQIVGADSMQIYRSMDIGTAKPTTAEKAAVPHHMVDIIDPDQAYDAASFGEQAHQIVQSLAEKNIRPFVVGGTGLYIRALLYGLFQSRPSDGGVRRRLKAQLTRQGAAAMHARLAGKDPQGAGRIHPNDAYRILRALEVIETTGSSISVHHAAHAFRQPRCRALSIGLALPRQQLYARIDRRVDGMVAAGLLEETRRLLDRGYDPALKSMQALGYRHMVAFIRGQVSWDAAIETLKRDHRRYAKRQLTWFRADPSLHWLGPDEMHRAVEMIDAFFSSLIPLNEKQMELKKPNPT
ncbi:MAG: tRNA (adenosine(37)-N6)-dimethylallyltransferase MiaA [Desulfobacteraceae bacterium]|nr:MAG: tRNA (adenosine(37)-N6)-dimethylallyltransferase MiaA [Desulfobacteraceae bacterium]